ncbi:hypothetical protein F2Q68_00012782 [Brassica cretica]|uniref:ENTH domain-containing protein n=1 Tax=Brassica cretica TaxID=69181 RepID=A0A8S9HTR2_BRACR|nr:hypothetical protein F2Q68_00012782 [Brassica cretica]
MGSSKLKRAIGAVKDQTSVGLAKVNGRSASLSELDVAIVKATRHEEYPAEEKYIREILSLTSYSRNYINACVNTLSVLREVRKAHRSWRKRRTMATSWVRALEEEETLCESTSWGKGVVEVEDDDGCS